MSSTFSFGNFAKELQEVKEEGVTFEDKQLTWDTAEDVKDVVKALETQKVVHYLKLDGNTLGVDAAAAIGKALEKHPEFRKALWKNMFTRRLKSEIPQALKSLGNGLMVAQAQLTVLDLSDNALGPNGMVGLEDLLRSKVCYSLQELRLNNCGLGIGGGQMLSKALLDCHRTSTAAGTPLKLKVFITGRNRLENDGAKAIAKIFSTVKTLEEIAMPQNSIYHDGIAALAEGFKQNPNLRILNLNDNTVTSKGAQHLADAFSYTPHLKEINFGDCLLKTNGAYHFAEALQENHRELEVVDLGFNEIGPDGGLVLATAMENKPNLQRLNLDGNQFGYEGRLRIKEAMEQTHNPDALEEMEEDQSEGEEDEDDDEDEDDETVDEEIDEEDEIYDEHQNDTTEEADEDDYGENAAEETAYTTTQAFTSKMLNANESFMSNKSVTFAENTTTVGSSTAESFCLSQKPCSLQMFDSLVESDKLQAFKSVIEQFTDDNYLLVLIFTTLKCAHLAQSSSVALDLAMSLYKECVDYAVKTKQERRVLNYLLQQLGLLRSEMKFQSAYNLKSCRYALRETLYKKPLASEHMKNTFKVFLEQLDV
ncbi:ran GTPase-activating protein [Musca vetustissima]|uniref:ran GTPase-activating protein n=1 Tax=Musca vetustissima TaxID=27455 RepID=UPI002AB786F9|nr:ran GTPase-activating protein [Musca vetustissima]